MFKLFRVSLCTLFVLTVFSSAPLIAAEEGTSQQRSTLLTAVFKELVELLGTGSTTGTEDTDGRHTIDPWGSPTSDGRCGLDPWGCPTGG